MNTLFTTLLLVISFNCIAQKGTVIYQEGVIMESLNRERTIRIYLPPNYNNSQKSYPVVYMHDAQNLFADSTSFVGEWHVDETLDSLYHSDGLELIVVGIDNGGQHRISEYTAWRHEKYGGGQGAAYADFIVNELKPMIDTTYRTRPVQNAVVGSSLGGLISHYMIFKYPEVFNKAGILSPSYWFSDELVSFTESKSFEKPHRMYNIMGSKEGEEGLQAYDRINKIMASKENLSFNYQTIKDGEHNEKLWSDQLAKCLLWLFEQ